MRAFLADFRGSSPSNSLNKRAMRAGKLKPTSLGHERLEGRYALSGVPLVQGLPNPITIQPVPGPTLPAPVSPAVDLGTINEDSAFRLTKSHLAACARGVVSGVIDVRNVRLVAGSGRLMLTNSSTWTYRPTANWFGEARISYDLVTGGGVRTVVGRVRVLPVNDAPVSRGPVSLGVMPEDGSLRITPQQLLSQSTDIDGDRLTVTNLSITAGQGGLTRQGDGSWIFRPIRDWSGNVRFSYTVSDGRAGVVTAAALVVSAVNDKPEASSFAHLGVLTTGTSIQLTAARLLSGSRDVDGDRLTIRNLRLISGGGTLSTNANGSWTLLAGATASELKLVYEVTDGRLSTGVTATMVVSAAEKTPNTSTTITVPAGSNIAYGAGGITLQSYPGNSLRYTNFPGSEFGLPSPMRIYVNGIYRALVAFIGTHTGRSFTFVDGGKGYTGIFPDSPDVYF